MVEVRPILPQQPLLYTFTNERCKLTEIAPVPRKKEGRAARLAAMEKDDTASVNSESAGGDTQAGDDQEDEDPRNDDPDAQLAQL